MKIVVLTILTLFLAACTATGRVQPRGYMSSDWGSGALLEYKIPTNR